MAETPASKVRYKCFKVPLANVIPKKHVKDQAPAPPPKNEMKKRRKRPIQYEVVVKRKQAQFDVDDCFLSREVHKDVFADFFKKQSPNKEIHARLVVVDSSKSWTAAVNIAVFLMDRDAWNFGVAMQDFTNGAPCDVQNFRK
ncbi:UNVERIFIED_CONTAM: hypothetical protein HDU68_003273, partial [Siphonaria sp. JEL0065]